MPVRPPSLRSIAAFEAAARHASFTKAADELNLTPGAISHAIRALENRLDQRLFDRRGRGVALTAAGQTLAARVRLSLGLLADAFDTAPWRSLNRLVISTTNSIAQKILLPHLQALQLSCLDASLDIRCSNRLADFDDGKDVAIRFGPGGWRGLQSRLLANEVLFPVVAPDYRSGAWPRTQAELGDHTLVHHPESSWRLWLDPTEPDPMTSAKALYLDDAVMVVEAAAAGHAIGLVRRRIAREDLRSGRLIRILERGVAAEYSYWAVWNASSPKLPLIALFTEAVERLFKDESLSNET